MSVAAIVSVIAATRTAAGLRIRSEIDRRRYPAGGVITDEQMTQVRVRPHTFHGEWN